MTGALVETTSYCSAYDNDQSSGQFKHLTRQSKLHRQTNFLYINGIIFEFLIKKLVSGQFPILIISTATACTCIHNLHYLWGLSSQLYRTLQICLGFCSKFKAPPLLFASLSLPSTPDTKVYTIRARIHLCVQCIYKEI